MVKNLEKKLIRSLKAVVNYVSSPRFIPVCKGTLAYILAFVLIFLKPFDSLSKFPLAYSSMMIIVIAASPGKSIGACFQAVVLGLSGVSLGCVGFVILAKLNPWPVAQGVVFAVMIYLMALVKAIGQRWFGFSLLFILQSFNGIYTSYLLGGVFSPLYLKAYYEAYLWGGVIVLAVNWLVFPKSSERELRQTLVVSLEHIGTFAHLLAKAYTLDISEEEEAARQHLSRTIRADFGYLTQLIEETTIEINYSRFSLGDYQCFVTRTRSLQQALITAHSSLSGVEKQDKELFKRRFLPGAMASFSRLRRAVDLTIRDLGDELGGRPMVIPVTQAKHSEYMDLEKKNASVTSGPLSDSSSTVPADTSSLDEDISAQMASVSERLAAEVENATVPATPARAATPPPGPLKDFSTEDAAISRTPPNRYASTKPPGSSGTATATDTTHEKRPSPHLTECGMLKLRREFDAFSATQHALLQDALVGGELWETDLRLHQPRASLNEAFGAAAQTLRQRPPRSDEKNSGTNVEGGANAESDDGTQDQSDTNMLMKGQSLIRVWGFLFALEQFVSELETLWSTVNPEGIGRKKRLHIHMFEALQRPHKKPKVDERGLSLPEAIALLEKRPYEPVRLNIWQHLDRIQHAIQSPMSLFAAKTAVAASVFATLIYASAPRSWFISFSLTSGMLTIVVALAPTLGQSILTFVLQIAGSGIGYLWGLTVLEMFRDVGGYKFNPIGITFMVVPYALIMQYVLAEKPAYFVVALLGLNATGVLVVTEWVSVDYLHRTNFDSPVLRFGKAISALMIALAIAAIFQLFIFRNPARRTLRKAVATMTYDVLSYAVLLQAYSLSTLWSSPESRPSRPALLRVERELRHREMKLQTAIINAQPLLKFAAAEPQFTTPFKKDVILRIINSNQLLIDRLREARAALGSQPFENFILTNFVSVLAPYRARHILMVKSQLYLIASSLQAKMPLPHSMPVGQLTNRNRAEFIHDCLILSARFSHTEEGKTAIGSREFMRYMSFLLCSTAVTEPLKAMEEASKDLYGELESRLL
ncbi:hypothetical protein JB92DRAFT_1405681 [Gautieria morchelliformis]|nr:hypothetical protein JB92DRAFT_1405681 [Gautieria morchelliformis]